MLRKSQDLHINIDMNYLYTDFTHNPLNYNSVVNSNTTQHYVIKFVTHGTAAHASAEHADDNHAYKHIK
jgi:hypothetical protein